MPGNARRMGTAPGGRYPTPHVRHGAARVGFDYNALALVAEAFGIELTPGMWRKVQAVETVIRRNTSKQAEKTQQASASTR